MEPVAKQGSRHCQATCLRPPAGPSSRQTERSLRRVRPAGSHPARYARRSSGALELRSATASPDSDASGRAADGLGRPAARTSHESRQGRAPVGYPGCGAISGTLPRRPTGDTPRCPRPTGLRYLPPSPEPGPAADSRRAARQRRAWRGRWFPNPADAGIRRTPLLPLQRLCARPPGLGWLARPSRWSRETQTGDVLRPSDLPVQLT